MRKIYRWGFEIKKCLKQPSKSLELEFVWLCLFKYYKRSESKKRADKRSESKEREEKRSENKERDQTRRIEQMVYDFLINSAIILIFKFKRRKSKV